jgi:rhamnosyl/mannosyltransferase
MQVNRFGLEDRIRFLGALPDSDLAEWYEACAVYVQPSISSAEAFGISMMEAMHFGKPVISTDLATGVQSVNRHLVSGLVVKKSNPLALSSAINSLLGDARLRHDLGHGASARVKLFAPERMIQSHLDLYRSLVPSHLEERALATDIGQGRSASSSDLSRDSDLSR